MVTGMSDVGIPDDIRDFVTQASTGLTQLIESEVLPMEQALGTLLTDERRFFDDSGKAVPAAMDARKQVRMKSAEAGYYAMFAPESVGGGGIGARAMVFIEEAMYRKYGPGRPLITWAKGFLSQTTIASFVDGPSHMLVSVSESVRKEFLPRVSSGEKTVCFALSEANAGSDVWGLQTKAKKDGDDWVINGSKQWITNSPYADYAIVFAVTDESMLKERKGGISAFFVETSAPGNMLVLVQVRGHISTHRLPGMYGGYLLGAGPGLLFISLVSGQMLQLTLGIVVIIATLILYFRPQIDPGHDSLVARVAAGAGSGFSATSTGIGGPPVVLYMLGRELEVQRFRATLQAYFLPISIFTLTLFAIVGRINGDVLTAAAVAAPAIVVGVVVGAWLRQHIEAELFRRLVVGQLVVMSLVVIAFAAADLV